MTAVASSAALSGTVTDVGPVNSPIARRSSAATAPAVIATSSSPPAKPTPSASTAVDGAAASMALGGSPSR